MKLKRRNMEVFSSSNAKKNIICMLIHANITLHCVKKSDRNIAHIVSLGKKIRIPTDERIN